MAMEGIPTVTSCSDSHSHSVESQTFLGSAISPFLFSLSGVLVEQHHFWSLSIPPIMTWYMSRVSS